MSRKVTYNSILSSYAARCRQCSVRFGLDADAMKAIVVLMETIMRDSLHEQAARL